MSWMTIIGDSLQYMESHLTEELTAERIADAVHVSPFCFQRGFAMLCGLSVAEYIRCRRLALAGQDLLTTDKKVIDIALTYGYDSPDSFTKAFTRFHGVTPGAVRRGGVTLKSFVPLKISFSLEGGYMMDYRLENKPAFCVWGSAATFTYEEAKQKIPAFWQEHYREGKGKVVMGMYGVNIDENMGGETFEYLIADPCVAGAVAPAGFTTRTIPALTWAVFPCTGPLPATMQETNRRIYSEWFPAMKDYEFAAGYCIEWYDDPTHYPKGTADAAYRSELWIPVHKK